MSVKPPEHIHHEFVDAFNARDLDRLVSLYEPDAAMMPEPGRVARGTQQVREQLRRLLEHNEHMTFEAAVVIQVGDLAYIANKWTRSGTDADGSDVPLEGVAAEVVRRQPDGGWRFVIGIPWAAQIGR